MTKEEKSKAIEEWCKNMDDDFCTWHCPLNDVIGDDTYCYTLDSDLPCDIDRNYDILVKAGCIKDEAHERFMNIRDAVHSPSHYCKGGIECIDAIRASMTKEAFAGYCKGNVIKYVFRYEQKGGKESLEKASVYLKWLIETAESEENNNDKD